MQEDKQYVMRLKDQRGVTAVVIGLILIMLLSFAALAVDIGYVMVTKNELQNVADAAALAATRQLGGIYESMSYAETQSYVCDPSTIVAAAQDVGIKNQAGRKNIIINADDVVIGTWDLQTKILTPTLNQPDAVRVKSRRDSTANSPITTFFARIFGRDFVDVWADATAALTGQSTAGPGGLPIPVGISKRWFQEPDFCGKHIRLYPSCPNEPCDAATEGCGGWHTYTDNFFNNQPPNAAKLRKILIDLQTGLESPYTEAGETMYEFIGGTVASDFSDMKQLFDIMRVKNDGTYDKDDDPNTWTTSVPVYESDTCANPNQPMLIIGFTTVVITQILESPDKIIEGMVLCDNFETGRGGGGDYGTKGSIPGLVE